MNVRMKTRKLLLQHKGIFFLLAALVILPEFCLAAENTVVATTANKKVSWSALIFKGSKFSTSFEVQMQLGSTDDASGNISSPKERELGTCPNTVHDGRLLTIKATSQELGEEDKYEEKVWFTEQDGLPYKRNRLNQGRAFWMKSYCWEEKGVRRQKVVPRNSAEEQQPQALWSQRTESLYRYPENRTGCSTISDPALILYKVSSLAPVIGQDPFDLCVFGKKQLHRLTIKQEGAPPLKVAYAIRSAAQKETVVEEQILPVVYAVTSENIDTANQTPETFSLFGLHKDIRIYLDPRNGIPVRISGTVNSIGTLELEVQNATIN